MIINRKAVCVFTAVLCLTMLTGCWDAKELDDLSIPLIAAYDLLLENEKEYSDDKYLITVGVPVFYKDVEKKFHIISTTGKIIGEARGRRNSRVGEEVILGQLQLLLLGEEIAKKEDLMIITDILTRNPRLKASMFITVVKGRAVDLVKKPIYAYPNVGIYLKALMKNSKGTNFYPYTTLFQFNRSLISYETSAMLPLIIYKNGEIVLSGSCLVNKGKLARELSREETEVATMLRGIKCRGVLAFDALQDGKVIDKAIFEGANSRKVTIERTGDKYIFKIKIMLTGVISEHTKQRTIQDGTDLLKVFQVSLEQHIKKRAEDFVKKTQEEFKFDALHLANYIKAYTREKLTKDDIDRIVQEAGINVEVKVKIQNVGGKM